MRPSSPNAVSIASSSAFRIVLFGMPDAGKSSLLGALAQAAQTQESVLGGKLIDKTHGLMELQRRLYEDRPRETLDEVVPYPIVLEPLPSKAGLPSREAEAVLVDCDGRAANDLLARKDSLEGDLASRAIAQSVLGADTLVLAVDVSAEQAHLKRDFGLFAHFLRTLEGRRGQRSEVGGLPVYLVLTKCDLLAKPEDTAAMWMDRIEERKKIVYQRFQEFLAQEAAREAMPFGKIDLHVWATAVKRPALADAPMHPKEPYGVAELFRQCLDSASAFRERSQLAGQRLGWVVGVLAALVGFMVLLALFFLATQADTERGRFEKDLQSFLASRSDSAAERLHEPLGKTIEELKAFQDNPLFATLPPELQKPIADQLREAEAYDKFSKQFQAAVKAQRLRESPRFAQNEAELDDFRKVLQQHPVPAEYRAAWEDTDLARRQRRWRDEIEVMETEVKAAIKEFGELQELGAKIRDRKKYTGEQLDQFLEELKLKDKNLPYRKDNHAAVRNSRVTFSNVAQFDSVAVQIARYEKIRNEHHLDGSK
jgi:GTPase SAR1 family protein